MKPDSRASSIARGAAAETLAASFLEKRGLAIVTRNYRCRVGEIDLIARDGATLVFVEVRLRKSNAFGGASASITASKQHRLKLAASHYLAGLGCESLCRFDAILLQTLDENHIEWLRNIDAA